MTPSRRAFALVELIIAIALVLAACMICAIAMPDARRRARLAGSIQNLQQIGTSAHAYAADNDNRVFSFSWQSGGPSRNCNGYVFPPAGSGITAGADQAVCIMRRRGNRPDITAIAGWIAQVQFTHLVLVDYLEDKLPSPMFVSPGDERRLAWARAGRYASENPGDQGVAYFRLVARPAGNRNNDKRWSYSSSYQMPGSFFGPDARVGGVGTFAQNPMGHNWWDTPPTQAVLGNRRMGEITFASQKVMMFESVQRYYGREQWFAFPDTRIPMLMSDGSAGVRSTSSANLGFYPNTPGSSSPTRINYIPDLTWEPPTASGAVSEYVNGVYLWTRSGLRGRDFNGPEVPWTP